MSGKGTYRTWMLGLLAAAYALNLLDRQIINIVAEPLKRDLGLSDAQLGAVTGLSFALLYSVVAVPIARVADRGNRVRVIGIAVLVWSAFTAASGAATNFVQLLAMRVGVGVGEAGCGPPSQSLIADEFPPEKRSSALAIFWLGAPVGAALGLVAGGLLVSQIGWRWTVVAAGVPGLLVGALVLRTLRDPRLSRREAPPAPPPLKTVLGRLLSRRPFVLVMLGCGLLSFTNYASMAFAASFYLRVHKAQLETLSTSLGLEPIAIIGLGLGLLGGAGGAIGAIVGGQLGNRLGSIDARWLVFISAIGSALCAAGYFAMFSVPDVRASLCIFFIAGFFSNLWAGPGTLALQRLAEAPTRATALAINLFVSSAIGLGLGPFLIGILSDHFAAIQGEADGLRTALLCAPLAGLLSAACYFAASIGLRRQISLAEKGETE
ncbi:major facilitator family transporter [Hyphomonas johnsonii MHS-2]|uniref:Major facilitator family transporter n=2 Tax=Hyphomonas johnsonii TaxID=81031 RepID=A0A059FNC5_9PROT|nr:major facilitator family transporter [Hyphomonas johnsonii MHS-2]